MVVCLVSRSVSLHTYANVCGHILVKRGIIIHIAYCYVVSQLFVYPASLQSQVITHIIESLGPHSFRTRYINMKYIAWFIHGRLCGVPLFRDHVLLRTYMDVLWSQSIRMRYIYLVYRLVCMFGVPLFCNHML